MPVAWTTPFAFGLLALVPLASVELAKALRWQSLLGPPVPQYRACVSALVAGQLTNALAPLRAGEAVQVGWLAAAGNPLASALAALAATKALDAVVLVAITLALLGTTALAHVRLDILLLALLAVVALLVTLQPRRVQGWLSALPFASKLHLSSALDVARQLHQLPVLAMLLLTSAVVWVAGLTANALVLHATGTTPSLDLAARLLVAGYIAGLLPGPPARLGVFEASATLALTSGGVPLPAALAAAVLLHVCQIAEFGTLLALSVVARRWSWSA